MHRSSSDLKAPLLVDSQMVMTTISLVLFGVVMVYSTTGTVSQEKLGDALYFVKRQGIAAIIGFGLMFLASRINLDKLRSVSPFLIFIAVALLVLTLIPGIGVVAGGARRWIKLGPVRFEPAEFVKVMVVIFVAGFLSRHERELSRFTEGVLKPSLFAILVGGLLLLQPDFGSTVVILAVVLTMATVSGAKLRYIGMGACLFAMSLAALVVVSPYRMSRILSFLSPETDASGKGYQLLQSLIAVGTGEVSGVGLGGSQQKLFFLPAAHTDFIFAVVAEEFGFIGCVVLLSVFLLFFFRGIALASRLAEDTFRYSLAVGLTMLIVLPALLNVGVVIGLLPTKGMVLPLVGYGGSSLLACLLCVGILLALARSFQKQFV